MKVWQALLILWCPSLIELLKEWYVHNARHISVALYVAFQFFSFLVVVNTKEPSNLRSFFLASRSAWRVRYLEFGRYCRFFFTSNHAGQRLSGQCCLGFHASVLWHAHERLQIHFKLFRMQGRSRISVLCRKIFHSRYMCGMSDFQVSLGKKCHAFCVSCVILISAFT